MREMQKKKKKFWCYLGVHYPEPYEEAEKRMREGVFNGKDSQGRCCSVGILIQYCEVCGEVAHTEVWH